MEYETSSMEDSNDEMSCDDDDDQIRKKVFKKKRDKFNINDSKSFQVSPPHSRIVQNELNLELNSEVMDNPSRACHIQKSALINENSLESLETATVSSIRCEIVSRIGKRNI